MIKTPFSRNEVRQVTVRRSTVVPKKRSEIEKLITHAGVEALYQKTHQSEAMVALRKLREQALSGGNIFAGLMKAARHCSLYQMTQALYEVGGQYRRNL